MKLLLADDDDVARRMITTALRSGGHEVVATDDGAVALEQAAVASDIRVLVLDANMRGLRGVDFRRRLAARGDGRYAYVILMTDTAGQQGILDGLAAGADAVLVKPFLPEELLARVRVAERILDIEPAGGERLLRLLCEAATAGSGEIVVRDGERVGRILVHDGRIAWAQLSADEDFVQHLGHSGVAISREAMRSVIEDARATSGDFTTCLVARGLVTPDGIREHVRSWIAGRIALMLTLPRAEVMFLPSKRSFRGSVTFSLDDVLPMEAWLKIDPPRQSQVFDRGSTQIQLAWNQAASEMLPQADLRAHLTEALAIEGAIAVGLFDGATGACLGSAGKPIGADLAEAQIKAMNLLGTQDDIEDMFTTASGRQYLLRAVQPSPRWFLMLVLDRETATIALARLKAAIIARHITAVREKTPPPSIRRSVSQSSLNRVRA
ncbi:MAG: response regulator [Polyangiaceae bacterium]